MNPVSSKKVAFLVDFDNVATDVIEQALNAVFKDYGAAHIRRAYCNAEQALREQHFLKRLGLRAIVNLAIGKNSTDIALAADAMDLAITEKPDVIVLVSSDSDFAPLVLRLREKGAWLRGFGQYGKTGDGVIQIYDQFNELAHGTSRSRDAAPAKPAGGGRGSRRGSGRGAGGRPQAEPLRAPAPQRPPRAEPVAAPSQPLKAEVVAPVSVADTPAVVEAVAAPVAAKAAKPAAKAAGKPAGKAAGKTARKSAVPAAVAPAEAVPTAVADAPKAAVKTEVKAASKPAGSAPVAAKSPAAAENPQVAAAKEINAILALLPKLADGQWHELGAAAKVLKEAGLLPKTAPSTKLFRKHPQAFELAPEKNPNRVRFGHG
jgi:hypothetical protein